MKKDKDDLVGISEMFGSATDPDDEPRVKKRSSSKKAVTFTIGFLLFATAGLVAAIMLVPQNPHAKQIGTALTQWSEESGGVEIPESTDYVTYFSYLTDLGPRIEEFGLPNFGEKSGDIMVKIVQEENAGSPFTVCSYDMSSPKQPVGLIKEYLYYSFSSETGEVKMDDPACNPDA